MIATARTRLARLSAVGEPRIGGVGQALRQWFAARSRREQRLIVVLGVIAAAVLLVLLVVRPLQAARTRAQADIHNYEQLDAQLRAAGPGALSTQPRRPTGLPATTIPEAAQGFGLTLQRIEPEGARTRVTLAGAPFEALLGWLAKLDADGIPVSEIRIDRQTEPGHVDVQLVLGR